VSTVRVTCAALPYQWGHLHPDGSRYQPPVPATPVPCTVAARKTDPPADIHVNPRHGQACACCGHTGSHVVDPDAPESWPLCVQAYGLDVLTGWTSKEASDG